MKNINAYKIILENTKNKYMLIIAVVSLLTGVWYQDVVFYERVGKITSNLPEFIKTSKSSDTIIFTFLYLCAGLLFYFNDAVVSQTFPAIELESAKELTVQTLNYIKTEKQQINVNELVMNLRKITNLRTIYSFIASYIAPSFMVIGGLIRLYSENDTSTAFVMLFLFFMLFLVTFFIEKKSLSHVQQNGSSLNSYFNHIQDIIINSDTIIINGMEQKETINLDEMTNIANEKQTQNDLMNSDSTYMLHNIGTIFTICMLALAVYLHKKNKIDSPKLISIGLMLITFLQYYESVVGKFRIIMKDIEKLNEVQQYFSQFQIHDDNPNKNFTVKNGSVVLKNVSINYKRNNDKIYNVLNNFNATINGNQIIGLTGNIGSGKTSVIKAIAGLVKYEGDILIDGQNIKYFNYDAVMKHIAYIPQHPKMFDTTVFHNIAYGTELTEQQIWTKLKKLNVANIFHGFSNKLQTNVGKEGNNLSGGQRQLIAIIRAVIQNKQILLLDEPTSSLDTVNKKIVINLFKELTDRTLIIVSHDQDIINIFNKTIDFNKKIN
jgi:ABC-type multidrug transport system fused ATPase/permease subunit